MFWVNWGAEGPTREQALMRVTETGAIITRTRVPRRHLYLGVLFAPDTLAIVVVAASRQALEARAEITAALSHWGAVTWPDDPAQYWTHGDDRINEPVVSSELSDALLGPDWPSPLTGDDFGLPTGEEPAAEADPDWSHDHEVDLEPSGSNDADEEAPAVSATDPPDPVEEGDPPGEEADSQQCEPATESEGGECEEEGVGDTLGIQDKVTRALSRRPEASGDTPPLPPWRDGSRPPRGTIPHQGGSCQRAAPRRLGEHTRPPGQIPKGSKDAQRARMGLSSSSTAGGPDAPRAYPALGSNDDEVRAQLQEAFRIAAESRAQAEAAQAAARAALERLESEAAPEPTPTRGQAAVARLEAEAKALTPGGGSARDRSRSARAKQQTADGAH